jgi:hypothetical protein
VNPLTGVLDEAWRMYRAHARHLITIAFVVYVIAAIVEAILTGLLGVIGAALSGIIGIIAAFVLQASLIKAVEDVRDGRADLSMRETVEAARPHLARVAIASILAGIAIAIGLALCLVPGLFLLTIWCMVVPVIVLERADVFAGFQRSQQLVRGHGMHVFGTIVIVFLLLIAADIVIAIVLFPIPQFARGFISGIVAGTLVAPFLAVVLTLGYYRLRAAYGGRGSASYGV